MNTRTTVSRSRQARGASVATFLVAIVIIAVLAAAVWFLILRPHHQVMSSAVPAPSAAGKKVAAKAPPPANVAAMSTSELLAEASKAITEQRLLAPAGNNAFEFYLKVLDRQPDNQVAKDALRETFPFAANAAEQVINAGNFSEANREIALLSKADPDNYTLTILRSKLDARRKVKQQQAQAEQLAEQRQQEAAAAAAAQQAKQEQLAKQKAAQQAAAAAAAKQQAREVAKQAPEPEPEQPEKTKPQVVIQNAVLVKRVKPRYPAVAARMRREGWVVVQFTVGVDGKVHNVGVIDADPRHVFDHAAERAVSRWEFKPALRNGTPMPVTMRKRIVFSLGNG